MREKTLKEAMVELEDDLNQLDSLILQLEEAKERRDSIAKTLNCLRAEFDCRDF